MDSIAISDVTFEAQVTRGGQSVAASKRGNHYKVECHDRHGNLKWVEECNNIIPTVGLNNALTQYYKGSSYTAAFYVGLISATPTVAAGDTMSSHAGWTEVVVYDEAVRQTLTLGTAASGSIDNSASKAQFTINDTASVGGAFITTSSTKSGTTGTLDSVAAFSANKSLADTDVLSVTVTCTQTSA